MQRKSLLTKVSETIDAYRAEQQNSNENRSLQQPLQRQSKKLYWLLPTPGSVLFTLILIASLIWLQNRGTLLLFAAQNMATASTGTIAY